jgi:hypothetical protein
MNCGKENGFYFETLKQKSQKENLRSYMHERDNKECAVVFNTL